MILILHYQYIYVYSHINDDIYVQYALYVTYYALKFEYIINSGMWVLTWLDLDPVLNWLGTTGSDWMSNGSNHILNE